MAARTKGKVTPKYKTRYRVKNWRAYEAARRAAVPRSRSRDLLGVATNRFTWPSTRRGLKSSETGSGTPTNIRPRTNVEVGASSTWA
jgi:hypothetical protein